MTNEIIYEFRTYNPLEATSSGYDIEFYENGQAKLIYETKWGSRIWGNVFVVDSLPEEVQSALDREINGIDHDLEPDLKAALWNWLSNNDDDEMFRFNPTDADPELPTHWKLIRKGNHMK